MPIYDHQCSGCGQIQEVYGTINSREDPRICINCGERTRLAISRVSSFSYLYPYIDHFIDAKPLTITSRAHYKRELKKRHLIEAGRSRGNKGQWI